MEDVVPLVSDPPSAGEVERVGGVAGEDEDEDEDEDEVWVHACPRYGAKIRDRPTYHPSGAEGHVYGLYVASLGSPSAKDTDHPAHVGRHEKSTGPRA